MDVERAPLAGSPRLKIRYESHVPTAFESVAVASHENGIDRASEWLNRAWKGELFFSFNFLRKSPTADRSKN
jgi:hypothetical protein